MTTTYKIMITPLLPSSHQQISWDALPVFHQQHVSHPHVAPLHLPKPGVAAAEIQRSCWRGIRLGVRSMSRDILSRVLSRFFLGGGEVKEIVIQ